MPDPHKPEPAKPETPFMATPAETKPAPPPAAKPADMASAPAPPAPTSTDTPLHQRSKLKFAATKTDQEPLFRVLKPCTSALHAPDTVHPYASFGPNAPFADNDEGHAKKAAATDGVITRLISLGAIVEHQEPEPPAS
jgi:hypothetical protein